MTDRNLILIAEDDPDMRDLLSVTLATAGYRTAAAKDGNTAAQILQVARPAGLITDVRMPALNGLELCELARRDPALRNTVVVMVSAGDRPNDVDAGLKAGADRYLPKPLSPRDLVRELHHLINERFA